MALTLTNLRIQLKIDGKLTNPLDLSTPVDTFSKSYSQSFTDGAGLNQSGPWFHDTRTLAGTATENLDLSGVLVGSFGNTLAWARVKAMVIIHKTPGASAALEVGGVTNQFVNWIASNTIATDLPRDVVRPGGWLVLVAPDATGYPVTNSTADLLKINNLASGSIDYDIFICGSLT